MDVEVLQSDLLLQGKIFSVRRDQIKLPNGVITQRESVLKHQQASVIVPFDQDGKIIFVRQYRHSVGQSLLELPAGVVDDGEDPLTCAKRELEEETGFIAGNIKFLLSIYTSPGYSDERLHIYKATDLRLGQQHFDFDEIIEVERHSYDEALQMIGNGSICKASTIVGILASQALQ